MASLLGDMTINGASLASSPPGEADSRWLADPVHPRCAAPACGGDRVLASPDGPPVMSFMYAAQGLSPTRDTS